MPTEITKTVTVAGVNYGVPDIARMDRAGAKRMRSIAPLLEKFRNLDSSLDPMAALDAVDSLYDVVGLIFNDIPQDDIDRLVTDDLKALIGATGLISFTGVDAPDEDRLTITLGESSASTSS